MTHADHGGAHLTRISKADRAFEVVLVLTLSNAFVVFGPLLGAVAWVTVLISLCGLFYIGARMRSARRVLNSGLANTWLALFSLWPIFASLYAPVVDLRLIGIHASLGILFVSIAVYCHHVGWSRFARITGVAVGVTVVGFILSWTNKGFFEAIARVTQSRGDFGDRVFGFFLQPNTAAAGSTLLFICWLASPWARRRDFRALGYLGLLVLVGVTGSRGGFATAVACGVAMSLWPVVPPVRQVWHRESRVVKRILRLAVLGCAFAVVAAVAMSAIGSAVADPSSNYFLQRIASAVELATSTDLASDGSGSLRLMSQRQYLGYITASPVWGYGLGAHWSFIDEGKLFLSSHNSLIEAAFQFGVPYVAVFVALLLATRQAWYRLRLRGDLRADVPAHLAFTILVSSLFVSTLFTSRTFIGIVGGVVGGLLLPLVPRIPFASASSTISEMRLGAVASKGEVRPETQDAFHT